MFCKLWFRLLASLILLFFNNTAVFAQELVDDTLLFFESQNDSTDLAEGFYDAYDSLASLFYSDDLALQSVTTFSSDSLTIAYGGDWSNDKLFLYSEDFDPSKMEDSIQVILQDDEGHCYYHPWPGRINSNFGWRRWRYHYGIDIDLDMRDSVRCAFDGVVRITKWEGGYGNVIVVRHSNGLETLYGHLTATKVVPNQPVKAGDLLGLGGSTGRSTGPHLHFEIRYKGVALDPNSIVDFEHFDVWKDTVFISKQSFKHISDIKKVAGSARYYKIRSGDTLGAIAIKYGTSVSAICRLNGIKPTTILRIGRTLRVR